MQISKVMTMVKVSNVVAMLGFFWFSSAFAATDFNAAFLDGSNFGGSHVAQPATALSQLNPADTYKDYNPNPSQTHYFENGQTLTNEGAAALTQDPTGQAVMTSFMQRPDMKVDSNSAGMQKAKLISSDAANIVNGISDQFVDCNKTQQCKPTYTAATCNEAAHQGSQVCSKTLVVQAIPPQMVAKDLTINVSSKKHEAIEITVDLTSGKIIHQTGSINSATVSGNAEGMACESFGLSVLNVKSTTGTTVRVNAAPNCANHLQAKFLLKSNWANLFYPTSAEFTVHLTGKSPAVITDTWQNQCSVLEQESISGVCQLSGELCTMGEATKVINGISVTRDCWQKQANYQCGQTALSDNNCQVLRDKGCEQTGSTCKTKVGDICVVYDQNYRCPSQKCTGGDGVVCNGETFCLKGDCTNTSRTPDANFSKDAAALNASAEATQQFDTNYIFKGSSQTCGDDVSGFSNCCRDTGWGKDVNLAHCDPSEKELGLKKEAGLTIYVGRYCSHKVLGVCTAHKKAYCTFQSKLSKIIQQQGRQGQLGIGFGGASDPNCKGLTPDQLSHIDFEKIDFSEYYSDLEKKENLSDPAAVSQKIQDKIHQMYNLG